MKFYYLRKKSKFTEERINELSIPEGASNYRNCISSPIYIYSMKWFSSMCSLSSHRSVYDLPFLPRRLPHYPCTWSRSCLLAGWEKIVNIWWSSDCTKQRNIEFCYCYCIWAATNIISRVADRFCQHTNVNLCTWFKLVALYWLVHGLNTILTAITEK